MGVFEDKIIYSCSRFGHCDWIWLAWLSPHSMNCTILSQRLEYFTKCHWKLTRGMKAWDTGWCGGTVVKYPQGNWALWDVFYSIFESYQPPDYPQSFLINTTHTHTQNRSQNLVKITKIWSDLWVLVNRLYNM